MQTEDMETSQLVFRGSLPLLSLSHGLGGTRWRGEQDVWLRLMAIYKTATLFCKEFH